MIARTLRKLLKADDGVTAIEYGLITALVAVVMITQVGLVGTALENTFAGLAAAMDQANIPTVVDGDNGGDGGAFGGGGGGVGNK